MFQKVLDLENHLIQISIFNTQLALSYIILLYFDDDACLFLFEKVVVPNQSYSTAPFYTASDTCKVGVIQTILCDA